MGISSLTLMAGGGWPALQGGASCWRAHSSFKGWVVLSASGKPTQLQPPKQDLGDGAVLTSTEPFASSTLPAWDLGDSTPGLGDLEIIFSKRNQLLEKMRLEICVGRGVLCFLVLGGAAETPPYSWMPPPWGSCMGWVLSAPMCRQVYSLIAPVTDYLPVITLMDCSS